MVYVQILINGILLGCLYGAIAVGFSLVWGVMDIINLAHGVMVIVGALVTYWVFFNYGINPLWVLPIAFLVLFIIGTTVQKFGLNRIIRAPLFMTFIFTFALGRILENTAFLIFGGEYRSSAAGVYLGEIVIGSITIPYIRIMVAVLAIAMILLFYLFMSRTKTGNAIRATRMNIDAAKLMGINVGNIYAITFGLSAGLAGASGALISTAFVFTATAGPTYLLIAFVACIIGGLGNTNGALVGGIALGIIEAFGAVVLGPGYREMVGMLALILILIFRPRGIMGMEYYD